MNNNNLGNQVQNAATRVEEQPVIDSKYLSGLLNQVAQSQDKQAFAILFQHFAPRVKSYVFKLGSDETMAEELAQQTMLQIWRKAHLFDDSKAVASTWIFRIARNLRLDLIRKEKHFEYDDHDLSLIKDDSDCPETLVGRDEQSILMRKAISTLPSEQIEIINLSFYEGMSHGDIASALNLPLGTVKSRMRLAFKKLKQNVEET